MLTFTCPSLFGGFSGVAHASPTTTQDPNPSAKQCLDAYSGGQRARKNGAFVEARRLFEFCGGNTCPTALHGDCQQWLRQVEQATPTSVFQVTSPDGRELDKVSIQVSGGELVWLTGQALEFEPGEHQLTFTSDGYRTETRSLTFLEGEKQVMRRIVLQPLEPVTAAGAPNGAPVASEKNVGADQAPATSESMSNEGSGTLVPVWLGLGVGAVGIGGFAYFGSSARSQDEAIGKCTPNCSTAQVRELEQTYLLANISLGVGAAGIVGALLWLLLDDDEEAPLSARSDAVRSGSARSRGVGSGGAGTARASSPSIGSIAGSLRWGGSGNAFFLSGKF